MVGVPVSNLLRTPVANWRTGSAAYDDDDDDDDDNDGDVQQPTTARPKVITQVVVERSNGSQMRVERRSNRS